MEERFEHVPLLQITPHPDNPRDEDDFKGPDFDQLVESIRQKGVLEPGIARPLKKGIQLVAGERRWRAAIKAAEKNGGKEKATMPLVIRNYSDDEAWEVMMMENIHRKDLNELAQAKSFQQYVVRKGKGAVEALSEKSGFDQRYIRRRIALMVLPQEVLKAWSKGELLYGHCEQLIRLKEKADVMEMFKLAADQRLSVRDLAKKITDKSPSLKEPVFDMVKAGCPACMQNSKVQKQLFDLGEGKEARCLNPKCFKQHVNNHFVAKWKQTGWYKQHHTTGFRFGEDYPSWGSRLTRHVFKHYYSAKPPKSCHGCEHFVTLIKVDGSLDEGAVCIKQSNECFDKAVKSAAAEKTKKEKAKQGKGAGGDPASPQAAPRVSWHGEHFRQEFFRAQIPLRLQEAPSTDLRMGRIELLSLLHSARDIHLWFEDTFVSELDRKERRDKWDSHLSDSELWGHILNLDADALERAIRESALQVLTWGKPSSGGPVYGGVDNTARRAVAEYLGADIDKEWTVTKEYLDKKTTPEIHAWAEMYGLWQTKEAQAYLYEILKKKRGKFRSCKKAELVQLILNCGLDLRGKLPKEIREAAETEKQRAEENICDACRDRAYESADPEDEDDFGCKSNEDEPCCKTCTIEDCKARQVCRKLDAPPDGLPDHTDDPCACGDPECIRPFGHPDEEVGYG